MFAGEKIKLRLLNCGSSLLLIGVFALGLVCFLESNVFDFLAYKYGIFDDISRRILYDSSAEYHRRQIPNTVEKTILFIGDSHIQGLNTSAITARALNFGIGGDTSKGLLQRISTYGDLNKFNCVVVEIGFNDIQVFSSSQTLANLRQIRLKFPLSTQILLNSVIKPSFESKYHDRMESVDKLNGLYREFADNHENTIFLDNRALFVNKELGLKQNFHIGDGLHLNSIGNGKWIAFLAEKLTALGCEK